MDRFEAYRTFAAVADRGGFAAAARRLGCSPAAVTRTVAALEADLGVVLFRRTTRVVALTEAGARFLVDVKRILNDVAESSSRLRGADRDLRGRLVVTAPVMFGRLYVTPILLSLLRRNPEVEGRALLVDRVVDIVEEGVDVAIRIAHLRGSALQAARVGAVRRVLCAAPSYLAERGRPRRPADLREHALIAFSGDAEPTEWIFAGGRRPQRVAISPRFAASSTEATIEAAVAGHGIARALSYQVADDVRAGRLELVLDDYEPPPVPIHVVHAGGARVPARVRAFVDLAVSTLRRDPRLDPERFARTATARSKR